MTTQPMTHWNGQTYTFANTVLIGSLKQVSLPTGGQYTLSYEPHVFFDSIANNSFVAGGTRIKEIRLRDHLTGVEQTRTYDYTVDADVATALSSGRLLRIPRFAFATPNTTTATTPLQTWRNALATSLDDLNIDPLETRSIGYGHVTETVTGRGRTQTTFAITGNADVAQLGAGSLWHLARCGWPGVPQPPAPANCRLRRPV
jgi:hypothetical protein